METDSAFRGFTSNYGRKYGEPRLNDSEVGAWTKYYRNTYGQLIGNPYYNVKYGKPSESLIKKSSNRLTELNSMRDALFQKRESNLKYTSYLENENEALHKLSSYDDPYSEILVAKYPLHRDDRNTFSRNPEVEKRLEQLDNYYKERRAQQHENALQSETKSWIREYQKLRDSRNERPSEAALQLKRYMDSSYEQTKRTEEDYFALTERYAKLKKIAREQKSSLNDLEETLLKTTREARIRSKSIREKYSEEAEQLKQQIEKEQALRDHYARTDSMHLAGIFKKDRLPYTSRSPEVPNLNLDYLYEKPNNRISSRLSRMEESARQMKFTNSSLMKENDKIMQALLDKNYDLVGYD